MTLPPNQMFLTHFVSGASTVDDTARALVEAHDRSWSRVATAELTAIAEMDLGDELNTLIRRCAQLVRERVRAA